jgi:ribosomal protein L7Ae-like RNA K-turn-binding protein
MDAALRLLGLGARARTLVIGVTGVRAQLQRGDLKGVVLAADASPRTQDKVARLALARGIPVWRGPAADRLGAVLGRPAVQAVGVADPALARGLAKAFGGVSGNDANS